MKYLCLLMLLCMFGCASKIINESPVTVSVTDSEITDYEKDAEILRNIHRKASAACKEDKLTGKECTTLDYLYQATRSVYIAKGDLYKIMLVDPSEKHRQDYNNANVEYNNLLEQLRATMLKYKIKE